MNRFDNLAALIYLKNKTHKWKNIAILLGVFSLLLFFKLIFGSELSNDFAGESYIASVKIEGVIFEDDFRSEILEKIAKEDSIKGVIVNIDSPGGGIVGSEILYNNLREIADKKPVVILMHSLAASGGYMAAVAGDYIIAHNGTLTGSIGVLMQSAEMTDLANKIGVKFKTYKSSILKGSPSPFEKSNPLVDTVINQSIADSYDFFTSLVKERRAEKLNKSMLSAIFDGRVFTGRQALKAGLIDEIGDKKSAVGYLEAVLKTKSLDIKEIPVTKNHENIIDRFFGILPFFNGKDTRNSGHEIMAIMN